MGTKSSTATTTIPSNVAANYNSAMANVNAAASTPYKAYSTVGSDFVAPLTSTQNAGVAGANTYANYAQPYYGEATDVLHGTMGQVNPYYGTATGYADQSGRNIYAGGLDVNQYLNPYLNYSLGATSALLNQNNQQAMAGQLGNAISQGAFGGDRAGIAAANLNQQQQMANAKIYSDILSSGYNTAMGVAQQQQGQALSADQANRAAALAASQQYQGLGKDVYGMNTGMARQLAETGQGAQDAGLAGAKAQLEAGGVEQATQQATKDALIKQFMQEQGYPFQVAQFLVEQNAALGPLYGQTTKTTSKSDVRLKENIKEVGKTFDGQPIYSYNFKGHPQTQIGLMAQEVEQHHPHAVSNDPDGYKSVDYAEATDHAAKRGHFAAGGVIPSSQGGPVDYSNAGEGFAVGGTPGVDMSIPGLGGYNPYETDEERRRRGSGPSGAAHPGLAPAPPAPEQPSAAQQASQMAQTAVNGMALASAAKGMMSPPTTSLVKAPAISGVTGGTAANTLGGSAPLTPSSLGSVTGNMAGNTMGGSASLMPHSISGLGAAGNTLGGSASLTPAVMPSTAAAAAPTMGSVGAGLGHTIGATGAGLGHAAGTALSAIPQALGAVGSGMGTAGTALAGGHLGAALGAAGHGLLAGGSALAGGLGTAAAGAGSALAAGAAGVGSAIASAIPVILSFFSDERLKEDIKPVGKTFDGQTVYSYRYKGEPETHMGMIAQEVEHHHPHAVGESHGYKTVNYERATHEAAERGHFASGGLAGRQGYEDGGTPFTLSKDPLDEFGRPIKPGFLDPRPYLKNIGETVGQATDLTRRTLLPKPTEVPINPLSYATGPIGAALGAGSDLAKLAFGKPMAVNPSATVPITGERPKETLHIDTGASRPVVHHAPSAPKAGGLSPTPTNSTTTSAPASTPINTDVAKPMADIAVNPFLGKPMMLNQYDKLPTAPSYLDTAKSVLSSKAGDIGSKIGSMAKGALTNPDILIPLLAGLGAAGSSDTTDTLSKVSAGLTGGAEAMQNIREFKAKRALSEAQGEQAKATAAKTLTEAAIGSQFVKLANGTTMLKARWLGLPEGSRPPLADQSSYNEIYRPSPYAYGENPAETPAIGAANAPAAQPVGTPIAEPSKPEKPDTRSKSLLDPAFADEIVKKVDQYTYQDPQGEEAKGRTTRNIETASKLYDAANSARITQNTLTTAFNPILDMPNEGLLVGGSFEPVRIAAVRGVNDIIRVASAIPGFPEALKGGIGDTAPDALASKYGILLAFARSNSAMQNNIPALEAAMQTVANPKMTKGEAIPVMASQFVANQIPQLANQYLLDSVNRLQTEKPGMGEYYDVRDVSNGFNGAFGQAFINQSDKVVEDAMRKPWLEGGTIFQAMMNRMTDEQIDQWAIKASGGNPLMANFHHIIRGR